MGNRFVLEDFRGRSVEEAITRLNELEVSYNELAVASTLPAGTVVDQWPAPGDPKPIGTIVRLQVSTGQPPVIDQP